MESELFGLKMAEMRGRSYEFMAAKNLHRWNGERGKCDNFGGVSPVNTDRIKQRIENQDNFVHRLNRGIKRFRVWVRKV